MTEIAATSCRYQIENASMSLSNLSGRRQTSKEYLSGRKGPCNRKDFMFDHTHIAMRQTKLTNKTVFSLQGLSTLHHKLIAKQYFAMYHAAKNMPKINQ